MKAPWQSCQFVCIRLRARLCLSRLLTWGLWSVVRSIRKKLSWRILVRPLVRLSSPIPMAPCWSSNLAVWPYLKRNKPLSTLSLKRMRLAFSREKFSSSPNPSSSRTKSISTLLQSSSRGMLSTQKAVKVPVLISRTYMQVKSLFSGDLLLITAPRRCHSSQYCVKDTLYLQKSSPWPRLRQKSDKNKARKSCSWNHKMALSNLSAKCKSNSSASPKSLTKTEPIPKPLP